MQHVQARDLVCVQHNSGFELVNGSYETRTSTSADYGDPIGNAPMAKLFGVQCANTVNRLLDVTWSKRRLLAHVSPYPIMKFRTTSIISFLWRLFIELQICKSNA